MEKYRLTLTNADGEVLDTWTFEARQGYADDLKYLAELAAEEVRKDIAAKLGKGAAS